MTGRALNSVALAAALLAAAPLMARAEEADRLFALHAQTTVVGLADGGFRSPYGGANSLKGVSQGRETWDATAYAGVSPWRGGELWINPEIDQGFGLSNTLGVAGYPSGEAYKVGKASPYFRLQRLFFRQTMDLGGESEAVEPDANQFGGTRAADRLVLTVGKMGVPDVFDTNDYAHDPRRDFLNWALLDTGTFDYAADAWGYTVGAAAEWYAGDWTWRAGLFDLSDVPNSTRLDPHARQFQTDLEVERRYRIGGRPGAIKLTGFLTRGRMGAFDDAVALAQRTGRPADAALVRRYRSRTGLSLDIQQQFSPALGGFVRAGAADGAVEPYEFADIDRTLAAGLSLKGEGWGRDGDTLGLAAVFNGISAAHQRYLAAGGLGILVGDGKLPNPGTEQILEAYYDLAAVKQAHVSLDYQFVEHPAYNRDRGPVSVVGVRLHAQM
ncbi:MAG TPA: carbohydrate porin [Caulobacteraceae bacterium]|jgi:high affinity Mn2+ porin|nr:carbohydrate porin [Caulobacteraceae bacterium]